MEDDSFRSRDAAPGPEPEADAAWRALNQLTPEEHAASIAQALRHWDRECDLWIFAYGSLIWKPECAFQEQRKATVYGHHRSLCLWSRINRGTADCPGLVLALDRGGCCHGLIYRIAASEVQETFALLWKREMQLGSYRPQWVTAHHREGTARALAFVINPASPAYAGRLCDAHILAVLRRAHGRYGSCAEYVSNTVHSLHKHGLRDAHLERLVRGLKDSG